MPIELRWIASLPASALHAAWVIERGGKLTDANLAAALAGEAQRLAEDLQSCSAPAQRVLPYLVSLAGGISEPKQLAEAALVKVISREKAQMFAPKVAEKLRQVFAAFKQSVPDVVGQLELRVEPLRSQWEARGPGLMTQVQRLLADPELIVSQADVLLVFPVLGGGGTAFLFNNTVLIEAVLADPVAGLPEVLRLAWGLAQLNCDLTKFQGELTRDQLIAAAELAMIPPVLTAGEELELCRFDPPAIDLALTSWLPERTNSQPDLAAMLSDWWETYLNSRPVWHVALAALAKMIVVE